MILEWVKTLMPLSIAIVATGGIGHPIIAGINERKKIKLKNAVTLRKNQALWDFLLKTFHEEFAIFISTSGKDHILVDGMSKTNFVKFSELTQIFTAVKRKLSLNYEGEYDLFEKTVKESIVFDQLDHFSQQEELSSKGEGEEK